MNPQKPSHLRRATSADIPQICEIETSAAAKFARIPQLAFIAEAGVPHDMPAGAKVQTWLDAGRVYVVEEEGSNEEEEEGAGIVGFIAAVPMDTSLLVAEISVALEQNGKGVGTRLLEAVFGWARERAAAAEEEEESGGGKENKEKRKARVSLNTYANVPWNQPWYEKRGFREVQPEELGPRHVAKMRTDVEERGLAREGFRRSCMMIELD